MVFGESIHLGAFSRLSVTVYTEKNIFVKMYLIVFCIHDTIQSVERGRKKNRTAAPNKNNVYNAR